MNILLSNDIINIEDFNPGLLKINKKSYKNIDICYTGYITVKDISDCGSINSANPLYFIVGKADGHIEEKNGNKYLVFDSAYKNKEVLKKYSELWDKIKNLIKTMDGKPSEYGKDLMKIKFSLNDNMPLNKTLKLHNLVFIRVVVRSVFEEDGKYYPQVFLDECWYEL